jgi:hypothetical protein
MRLAFLCVTVGILALAACGDNDPTGPAAPNLVGAYDGTWTVTVEGPGLETTTQVCPGTVTVTEQSGGVFEGTFSQSASEGCDAGSGFVTGAVAADGAVSLLLGASGGGGPAFEESTGCTILSADDRYTGSYAEGALSFETSLTAQCPESGSVTVVWTFAFSGS